MPSYIAEILAYILKNTTTIYNKLRKFLDNILTYSQPFLYNFKPETQSKSKKKNEKKCVKMLNLFFGTRTFTASCVFPSVWVGYCLRRPTNIIGKEERQEKNV